MLTFKKRYSTYRAASGNISFRIYTVPRGFLVFVKHNQVGKWWPLSTQVLRSLDYAKYICEYHAIVKREA